MKITSPLTVVLSSQPYLTFLLFKVTIAIFFLKKCISISFSGQGLLEHFPLLFFLFITHLLPAINRVLM